MHQLDIELGLAPKVREDYSGADGAALYVACKGSCNLKHPFSRTKRDACKEVCAQKLEVRQETGKIFGAKKAIAEREATALEAAAAAELEAERIANEVSNTTNSEKKGLSTGAMIGIGVGVLLLVVGVAVIIKRRK